MEGRLLQNEIKLEVKNAIIKVGASKLLIYESRELRVQLK
jgi:hypothetical protein